MDLKSIAKEGFVRNFKMIVYLCHIFVVNEMEEDGFKVPELQILYFSTSYQLRFPLVLAAQAPVKDVSQRIICTAQPHLRYRPSR